MSLTKPSNPVRIILDTTRRCQLTCWYCHSSSGPDYRGPVLRPDAVPGIMDAADRLRAFDLTITGGEPTLWPGLVTMLENSHRLQFASLQLITNGFAVSRRILQAIETAALSRICVSLDGFADVHDTNRGPGSYARTIRGIRELRKVHDNLTVISVIGPDNHFRWPELTWTLVDLGVSQHHLVPICFAGHAMRDYRGLNEQQFKQVRDMAETMAGELPAGFILLFNDTLIRPPSTRTMSLYQLTETWKGWHIIVRPDGDIKTAVRAWGRSWRADETLGSVYEAPLTSVIESNFGAQVPFTRAEEIARKFHLGTSSPLIIADRRDVAATENGRLSPHVSGGRPMPTVAAPAAALGISQGDLAEHVRRDPERYRVRKEDGFALLFDTRSHSVTILKDTEFRLLNKDLTGVPM